MKWWMEKWHKINHLNFEISWQNISRPDTGWSRETVNCNIFLTDLRNTKKGISQSFLERFWYLNVSVWSGDKKSRLSGLCKINILAPCCKDREPRYTPSASDRLWFPLTPLWCHQTLPQTSPGHPQGIPRERDMPTEANRGQKTPTETARHWQVLFEYVWWCLLASVVAFWHFVFPGAVGGCLGDV